MFEDDRRNRYAGKPSAMIPVVAENPGRAVRLADGRFLGVVHGAPARPGHPPWRNEVTLRSVEMFTEYEPGAAA